MFQRYAGDHSIWTSGGEAKLVQSQLNDTALDRIERLLRGQHVGAPSGCLPTREETARANSANHHFAPCPGNEDRWVNYETGQLTLV